MHNLCVVIIKKNLKYFFKCQVSIASKNAKVENYSEKNNEINETNCSYLLWLLGLPELKPLQSIYFVWT